MIPALRPENYGKFVAIDVETGDHEINEDDYTAVTRLRSRKPAADVWLHSGWYDREMGHNRGAKTQTQRRSDHDDYSRNRS